MHKGLTKKLFPRVKIFSCIKSKLIKRKIMSNIVKLISSLIMHSEEVTLSVVWEILSGGRRTRDVN